MDFLPTESVPRHQLVPVHHRAREVPAEATSIRSPKRQSPIAARKSIARDHGREAEVIRPRTKETDGRGDTENLMKTFLILIKTIKQSWKKSATSCPLSCVQFQLFHSSRSRITDKTSKLTVCVSAAMTNFSSFRSFDKKEIGQRVFV